MNNRHTDIKYINLLSNDLKMFKVKNHSPYKVNFRCPKCGDSSKSKYKARGWFYEGEKGNFIFHCYNECGSQSFKNFLKDHNHNLYENYISEVLMENEISDESYKDSLQLNESKPEPKSVVKNPEKILKGLKKVSQIKNKNHIAHKHLRQRNIPHSLDYQFYYCQNFRNWINENVIPDKFPYREIDRRLVIPLRGKDSEIFGFLARALDQSRAKYLSVIFKDDYPRVFGLDRVDFQKTYFIVEGPIDSLFLPNCIAMMSLDFRFEDVENIPNGVVIFDNEPRNRAIVKKMKKCAEAGFRVCVWPEKINGQNILDMDINDMIQSGIQPRDIYKVIKSHAYKGMMATLEINEWGKVKA